jgi:SulP family sulfate permease
MRKLSFSCLRELSGGLGDLGTFIPIFIALVALNGLNPAVILITAGILYIICGLYYKLPIPVQPLKAMAAVAITLGLGSDYIQAASIIIGLILLAISLTNVTKFLPRVFTAPIIKGMQLGVGLMLIKISLLMVLNPDNSKAHILSITPFNPANIWNINLLLPPARVFNKAFWILVLPQLPLTLGNAIVGTRDVAKSNFAGRAYRVTEHSLCLGLGIINTISGLISGYMPLCHGSSGLTAHISFGARTGKATIFTGVLFLFFGVILAGRVEILFKMIPNGLLGIMLFYVGFRHAALIVDLKEKKGFLLAIVVGIIGLLTNNLTFALCLGIAIWHISQFACYLLCRPDIA